MEKEKHERVEVKVNFLSIDRGTGAPIVVLKEETDEAEETDEGGSSRILLIWIGESEAAAIQLHLEKRQLPRPMTHDLLKTLIGTLGAEVTEVCVRDFEERTFYAHMILEVEGDTIEVDCRPSDAIALAIRCEAPIYVMEHVIAEQGFSESELNSGEKPDTKDVLENLDDDTLKQYTV